MKPAAFQATYSDFRLVRSRKVVQLVFEVPLEASTSVLDILGGMPNPAAESWCAIARLDNQRTGSTTEQSTATTQIVAAPAVPSATPARSLYAQQAGILCNDPKFRRFIAERTKWGECTVDDAAKYVRDVCRVVSRSEIKSGTPAENRWNLLVSAYHAWSQAPAHGAA